MEYRYLDTLALIAGSDKSSDCHNYTETYAEYFSPLKDKPIKFLEIGIYKGSSVKLWEDYFSQGELHFIDITLENIEHHSTRSRYHLADQANPEDLEKFIQASGGNFDVIIDDGGHMMNQQIVSFITLFPHVKSGGLYIVEDLHTSYWPQFGGGNHDKTALQCFKSLIDEVNFVGNHTAKASHREIPESLLKSMNEYQKNVKSITFCDSLVIIRKR